MHNWQQMSKIQTIQTEAASLLDQAIGWLTTPEHYTQLALAAAVLLAAHIASAVIRAKFTFLKEPAQDVEVFSGAWFLRRTGRLIAPLLYLVLFQLAIVISNYQLGAADIVSAFSRVMVVWLLWVGLRAFVLNPIVRTAGVFILVPAACLQLFGVYGDVSTFLSEQSVTIGDITINAYTVIKGLFLLVIAFWIGQILSRSGKAYIRSRDALNVSTQELLAKIFEISLYIILFLIALDTLGIDLTALAVFSGAFGVGLGFGLQKIASNFISGIILLSERNIVKNNLVEMDDGVLGFVRHLGARATIIETYDGQEVMVPNEDFITSRVSNLTHSDTTGRIEIDVGVSYGSDMHKVHELILNAATSYKNVSKKDTPKCFLLEYGDSSVNFKLQFWVDDITKNRWQAKSDVMFAIWDSFKEHDIEIPFPQRDLHIRSGLDALEPKKS